MKFGGQIARSSNIFELKEEKLPGKPPRAGKPGCHQPATNQDHLLTASQAHSFEANISYAVLDRTDRNNMYDQDIS